VQPAKDPNSHSDLVKCQEGCCQETVSSACLLADVNAPHLPDALPAVPGSGDRRVVVSTAYQKSIPPMRRAEETRHSYVGVPIVITPNASSDQGTTVGSSMFHLPSTKRIATASDRSQPCSYTGTVARLKGHSFTRHRLQK
jgi:hypothetical protein